MRQQKDVYCVTVPEAAKQARRSKTPPTPIAEELSET
jgi:hypothetical protein